MDQGNESQDLIASLTTNYRVLPLYEKSIADYERKKHVSLQLNKYLACKWQERKESIGKLKRTPFDFPRVSDYHFHNNETCYKPSESINNRTDFRYTLITGPGVDEYGDIPIPNDLGFRSTVVKPNKKSAASIKKKTKKKEMT